MSTRTPLVVAVLIVVGLAAAPAASAGPVHAGGDTGELCVSVHYQHYVEAGSSAAVILPVDPAYCQEFK